MEIDGLEVRELDPSEITVMENSTYYTSMAGEFSAMSQLFLRDYTASLTYGNAKSVDILVSTKSGKMFRLEVKTSREEKVVGSDNTQFGKNFEWRMDKKHEEKGDPNLFYCFVILKGTEHLPRFFILRSEDVAKYIKKEHQYWLGLERDREVLDTSQRIFRIGLNDKSHGLKPIEDYENRWDILPK